MSLQLKSTIKKILTAVLILSLSAVVFAENQMTVKVGYYEFPRYQEGSSDDAVKYGYAYEYLQKIASYTGWKYEYVYGERASLLQDIKKGNIDILVGLPKEDVVSGNYVYSLQPTIVATYYLFQSSSNPKLNIVNPDTFIDSKIGILKGSEGAEKVKQYVVEKKLKCQLVEYDNYKDFRTAFFNKEFDAFVSTDLELSDNTYVSIIDSVGNHALYAALSTENPQVALQFNAAQEEIREENPLYLDHLHAKYFNERLSNLISDRKDFEWVKSNNEITIGYIENYMPFCGTDSFGQTQGMLVDIVQKFRSFAKTKYIKVQYKSYAEYPEAMKALRDGSIDVLFPFYGDLWLAEKHELQISEEVYQLSMVMITDQKKDFSDCNKIAVSKRSPLQIFYVDLLFPNIEVVYVDTFEDCVNAVKTKKADATISNRFRATSYLNTTTSIGLDMKDLRNECPISFAVKRGNISLLTLIDGLLLQVEDDYINNSVFLNSYSTQDITVREFVSKHAIIFIFIILLISLTIVGIAYTSVSKAKKTNSTINAQKKQLEQLLRQEIVSTATIRSVSKLYLALYYINMDDYQFTELYANGDFIRKAIGKTGNALIKFDSMNKDLVIPEDFELMQKFNDLTTLKERLGNRLYISQDFRGPHYGWCESFFIGSDRNTTDNFSHVIYAVRSIEKEKELLVRSNTDELTGCLNRRSYEEDIKEISLAPLPEDLIVVSLDVNGLKNANDDIGHDAGDELIIGASKCIEKAFGTYGKVYRIGGDEFIACINASQTEYSDITQYFEDILSEWKGKLIEKLSVSYGSASVREYPETSITEIAKTSDKRMYENKELFYSKKGVDRRSSQAAFETLRVTYTKILKVNLATDEYSIMMMDENERSENKGFRNTISGWLKAFAETGQVHPEDKEKYLERTDLNYMKDYFKKENKILTIRYRRMTNNVFQDSIMDIIPVSNYSESNQIVFLYVKNI